MQRRHTTVPRHLQDYLCLESTSHPSHEDFTEDSSRALYYYIIDKVLVELHSRFDDSREIILAVAACNPNSKSFLNYSAILPLANECSVDVSGLNGELQVVNNLLSKNKGVETTEDLYSYLCTVNPAFPNLKKVVQGAITIPVSSASAERSFSALKRIKTYLHSTMTANRLSSLAILSVERSLSKEMDYDAVIDNFAAVGNRRITLS